MHAVPSFFSDFCFSHTDSSRHLEKRRLCQSDNDALRAENQELAKQARLQRSHLAIWQWSVSNLKTWKALSREWSFPYCICDSKKSQLTFWSGFWNDTVDGCEVTSWERWFIILFIGFQHVSTIRLVVQDLSTGSQNFVTSSDRWGQWRTLVQWSRRKTRSNGQPKRLRRMSVTRWPEMWWDLKGLGHFLSF